MSRPQRSTAAVVTLFFVAPFVAEFLLGDFSVGMLGLLLLFAPMYGGGGVLIRETARRSGRGWPAILLLGVAYTLIEEGFTTRSLFNPNYLHMHFLRYAWVPVLGIGGWWTMLMLNVHVFWSMGVSIALVEGLFPERERTPWLGAVGSGIVAALFLAGVAAGVVMGLHMDRFRASPAQFEVTGVLCLLLIGAAFAVPRSGEKRGMLPVPSPWATGAVTFVLGVFIFLMPPFWGWGAVAIMAGADIFFLVCLWGLSSRRDWTALHTLSVGAGGAVFYGVHAFIGHPVVRSRPWVVLLSHVVFLVLDVALVAMAVRRTRAWTEADRNRAMTVQA
jgi:MFS family permease